MRRQLALFLISYFALTITVSAQQQRNYYAADRTSYSKEVELAGELISYLSLNTNKPIGDWKETYSFGAEPEFGLRYHIDENWSITGRVAYNYIFGKAVENYQPWIGKGKYDDAKQFTITGGGRYNFNQNVWINAELGYTSIAATNNSSGVTWGLSSGYDLFTRRNILGLGLGYNHFKLNSNTTANAISVKFRVYFGNREKVIEE
jgi:hypothetical protein